MKNIVLMCNVESVFLSCKTKYGEDSRIDFEVLRDAVYTMYDEPINLTSYAYIVTHPNNSHEDFKEVLTSIGYIVKEKKMEYVNGVEGAAPLNMPVKIAVDSISFSLSNVCDEVVLATGPEDYSSIFARLSLLDKLTTVVTFNDMFSPTLFKSADRLYYFTKEVIY